MRPPALRLGASLATGLVLAAGVLAASPATAAPVERLAPSAAAPTAAAPAGLVINEVESNGDDVDWVELANTSSAAIDVSGWSMLDDSDAHIPYVLPAGSVVAAGGFLVVDQRSSTAPGFDFGLGNPDEVRFSDTTGAQVLSFAWQQHAAVTYGRCAGTTTLVETTRSTKGAANDCSSPIRVNEVESQDGTPGDWVELVNTGTTTVDLGGFVFRDAEDTAAHTYTVPAGTTIAPGGFTVLDEAAFGFGLGKADSARLWTPAGVLVDSFSWSAHAATTWGRNPDGTGTFAETAEPTKGAANRFAGVVTAEPWPGGPDETVLDAEGTFSGDLSGLDWQSSATATGGGVVWAVQNGDGLLYRLVSDGSGGWAPSNAAGSRLRYADGSGTPDAEGVTVTSDDPGAVYVSTERDNAVKGTSRPSVLRYAPTTGSESTLRATAEWDLAADFPGLGANAGLEGVTWVPDSWLTGHGFRDEHTGGVYAPASYPGHGGGLFLVGVEGTASVYAYALMADGSSQRVATIASPFSLVAEVQFDPELDALWVVCDEACSGRTARYEVTDGAFSLAHVYEAPAGADRALANEGFTISDVCTDGHRATFYADDADTDGASLRTGTLPCTTPTPAPTPTPTPGDGTPTPAPGDGTPTPAPGTGTPTPAPGNGTPTPAPGDGGPIPTPAPGGGGSVPATPVLTDGTRGGITVPATVRAGETVTVGIGREHAGEQVAVWWYSTPVLLGTPTVAADGTVRVTVPSDAAPGAHRVAVVAADGSLIGWDGTRVLPMSGELAFTGVALGSGLAAALVLLAAGGGLLAVRRHRRAA